jgi:hypothetical protein
MALRLAEKQQTIKHHSSKLRADKKKKRDVKQNRHQGKAEKAIRSGKPRGTPASNKVS